MLHYHVCVNTPGYMPDPDSVVRFDTLQEAQEYAREEAQRIIEEQEFDDEDPYTMQPETEDIGRVRLTREGPYSLDLVVDVMECNDDCEEEEDEQPIGCDHTSCDVDSLPVLTCEEG